MLLPKNLKQRQGSWLMIQDYSVVLGEDGLSAVLEKKRGLKQMNVL